MRDIVGTDHVLTEARQTRRFRKGYRYGDGKVLAVVRPGTLVEQWRVFKAAVEGGCIVIMQAANTGLNGGSTPFGDYDRRVVIARRSPFGRATASPCVHRSCGHTHLSSVPMRSVSVRHRL